MQKTYVLASKFALAALVLAAHGVSHSASYEEADISGFKIGGQMVSAKPALQKINPAYTFDDIKLSDGRVVGLSAVAKIVKPNTSPFYTDQFILLQNEAGVVWFAGRTQQIPDRDKYINRKTLRESLEEKYGKSSYAEFNGMSWEYDISGKQYFSVKIGDYYGIAPCYTDGNDADNLGQITGTQLSMWLPRKFSEKCGFTVISRLSGAAGDSTGALLSQYTVSLINPKLRHDMASIKAAKEALEKKKLIDQESQRSNKPKL
ncbi:hypothetical protein [Undibacterium sp. RuTC16W]|uniref:hypothetical protein n=1 Tax=Undibacterium sp. RuTC16W TaxID=3413048 RepID=UPI003BEF61B7